MIGRDIWVVPASDLSVEVLGRDIPNTAMLGATVKATKIVKLASLLKMTQNRFMGKIGELNNDLIHYPFSHGIAHWRSTSPRR